MGTCTSNDRRKGPNSRSSAAVHVYNHNGDEKEIEMILDGEETIPMEVAISHFTPASFPLLPTINKHNAAICASSWKKIVNNDFKDDAGNSTSGIVVFYNEFYERLDDVDSAGKFEAVLSRHSTETNRVQAKGSILIRIIQYVLKIEENNQQTKLLLYMLGKSHAQKMIRPWQYSVFVQTLLLTISNRLGTEATTDVMSAWVNLFAFVMKGMLPNAIKGQIVETELNINTSSEFAGGKIAQEVQEIEEVRELKRKFGSSHDGSDRFSSRLGTGRISARGGLPLSSRVGEGGLSARAGPNSSARFAPVRRIEDKESEDDF
mmetsp:Transcript_32692/g.33339  ORF Transcript_32692/g.33339 Transcript_32692/m.33339 type:complete len:319 (+) Transcript_32692:49-1005(+)|eukprot:CAMPEP_0182416568 /NCGR_PEP_ID=MMETSP1167-20130531/914_1 /TAXON_ID=2988 /ORGANISM="Mallomonas Sp, Strain CCMP3275" /LENGTH=318 /DNA_ID=CAMNT_0024589467 /DNA_START=37 /DNA_END=993 /DNA_ORIENTATION=+